MELQLISGDPDYVRQEDRTTGIGSRTVPHMFDLIIASIFTAMLLAPSTAASISRKEQ